MLGFNKKEHLVGIEITSSVVRALQMDKKNHRLGVSAYDAQPLPTHAVVEGRIEDEKEVTNAIRHATKNMPSKHVAASIPTSSAMSKIIPMPSSLSENDLEKQVMYEAESFISRPIEEVQIAFDVIGASKSEVNSLDVFVVAARNDVLNKYTEVIKNAGLIPKIIDLEAHSIEKAFSLVSHQLLGNKHDPVLLVDIGAATTYLHVIYHGNITFTHSQSFGGRNLTEQIERAYGLSHEEADQAKKAGDVGENYLPDILEPFKHALANHVTRGLQLFFSNTDQQQSIAHIVLAGGSALIAGIKEVVEEETKIPTSIADPLSGMAFATGVDADSLKKASPAMLNICGLAMRGVS